MTSNANVILTIVLIVVFPVVAMFVLGMTFMWCRRRKLNQEARELRARDFQDFIQGKIRMTTDEPNPEVSFFS